MRRLGPGEVVLHHRFRDGYCEIPDELMPENASPAELVVKANCSERRATLYVEGDGPFVADCTKLIAIPVLALVLQGGQEAPLDRDSQPK